MAQSGTDYPYSTGDREKTKEEYVVGVKLGACLVPAWCLLSANLIPSIRNHWIISIRRSAQ